MEFREKFEVTINQYECKQINLTLYERKIRSLDNKKQTKLSVIKAGSKSRLDLVEAKEQEALTIKRLATEGVRSVQGPILFTDVRTCIQNEVQERWFNVIPISHPKIYRVLKQRFVVGEFHDKFLATSEQKDKLCYFVTRALTHFNFCARKSTVSHDKI